MLALQESASFLFLGPGGLVACPGEVLDGEVREAGFGVDEDDVEAAADRTAAVAAAGGHEPHAVAQLDEFLFRDGTDADLDEVAQDFVVLLQDADDGGVPVTPSPGLPVVVSVLAGRAAELPVFPPIGQRVAALETVRDGFLQSVLHSLPRFTA